MRNFLICACLLAAISAADAASTVNPTVPAASSPLSSAPIRNNFQATYNDITALQSSKADGASSATAGDLAAFGDITGKVLTDSGIAPPSTGTWTPTSPQTIGTVFNATYRRFAGQTCVQANFNMPNVTNSSFAVVQGLPFAATVSGQLGLDFDASHAFNTGLYVSVSGSQFSFIVPNGAGGIGTDFNAASYTQLKGLNETVSFCYY